MSALGHKRTFKSIIAQGPLPGVKRTFELNEFVEIRGPFPERPLSSIAVIRRAKKNRHDCGACMGCDYIKAAILDPIASLSVVIQNW